MAMISFKFSFSASLLLFSLCFSAARSVDGVRSGVEEASKCASGPLCKSICPVGYRFHCHLGKCWCQVEKANAPVGVEYTEPKCQRDEDCLSYCKGLNVHCYFGMCECLGDKANAVGVVGSVNESAYCTADTDCDMACPVGYFVQYCDNGSCKCIGDRQYILGTEE